MKLIVIGGGAAGAALALACAREGRRVTVLERDAAAPPADAGAAFSAWRRPGVPQMGHSHAFLARLRNLLRDRAPDLLAALLDAGAREIRFLESLPPSVEDRSPRPGDEDLALLACRRSTFEWVLRRAALAEPGVEWRSGARVLGLEGEVRGGVARVSGVRVQSREGGDETLRGDCVVDASGHRSRVPGWLRALGSPGPDEEDEDAGIFYASRFYRLRPGAEPPVPEAVVGADLGYMKYGIFRGDADTFSVTLAAATGDPEMGRLLRAGAFDAAARSLPATCAWIDSQRAEPLGGVRGMAGLRNRRRRFVVGDAPVALGLFALGDAAVCTNPLYGRGCALAFVHAWGLADVLRETAGDADAAARAFDALTRRELEPWYRAARDQDRDAREVAAAERRGEDPFAWSGDGGVVDPRRYMRALLRDGLLPLLRSDADAMRAFARAFNLLTPPEDMLSNAALLPRILACFQARESRPRESLGPPRTEMVDVLARAA